MARKLKTELAKRNMHGGGSIDHFAFSGSWPAWSPEYVMEIYEKLNMFYGIEACGFNFFFL